MKVIHARNVNDAYVQGLQLLLAEGEKQSSRVGEVLVYPMPVMTVYEQPTERVLFNTVRDANPFFHLGEALWMLAGHQDARWLDRFVKDYSERFAERDGIQHGAYGYRWRHAFGFDQLEEVIIRLKNKPNDRQAVIQMWDANIGRFEQASGMGLHMDDLRGDWKDRPCNTHVYLRVRQEARRHLTDELKGIKEPLDFNQYLDITVCCRSNDAVWGAYGANAVHFSVLQEYLAARIGVGVGRYYQLSNNFHVYTDILPKLEPLLLADPYVGTETKTTPIVTHPLFFDTEVRSFVAAVAEDKLPDGVYKNTFLTNIAWPLFQAYKLFRAKDLDGACSMLEGVKPQSSDWVVGARQWMVRRRIARMAKVRQNV